MKSISSSLNVGPGRAAGVAAGTIVLLVAVLAALALGRYTTEYGAAGKLAAAAIGATGLAAAALVFLRVSQICRTKRRSAVVMAVAAALVILPAASLLWPARITASRFGLTVYGLVPIPFLDLRIGANGVPWFRDKTHHVSEAEARALVTPDVEVLVIGAGWDNLVRVDPAVQSIKGIEVIVLPTPDAFAEYNRLKSQGRRVALLAHSTC